jgi:hypothetical protein
MSEDYEEGRIIVPDDVIADVSKYNRDKILWERKKEKKPKAALQYKLVYDSSAEGLEPVYFWLLDLIQGFGLEVTKINDNFSASPGSGYFSEIGARTTRMQEEGMKILGVVNQVVKSVINILYDLKEFEIRLKQYEDVKSKDPNKKIAGLLALKQLWMDNVDIKRGRGSINQMTYELNFATLRDAFMAVNTLDDITGNKGKEGIDVNERVKKVLMARVEEFLEWKGRSESELTRRYNIQKTYLKSQVDTLKLYTRWVKPYLKAAEELRMRDVDKSRMPWMVSAFNTMVLELSLLCTKNVDIDDKVYNKILPPRFKRLNDKEKIRKTSSVVMVDFAFRGIPRKVPESHYVHGGRVEVTFRAYTMNEDERLWFDNKLDKSDLTVGLGLAEGITKESLKQLTDDIDYFLKKGDKEKEEAEKLKEEQQSNPFTALLGIGGKLKAEKKKEKTEEDKNKEKLAEFEKNGIRPDSYEEERIRALAEQDAIDLCFKFLDLYKKSHGMAAFPIPPKFGRYFEMTLHKNPFLEK